MKSMNMKLMAGAALLAVGLATPAFADGLTGSAAFTTDYLFRGLTQNNDDPTPQASIGYDFGNGFSIGTWTSAVDFTPATDTGRLEDDLYANYATSLDNLGVTFGVIYYTYPVSNHGDHYNYAEGSISLSYPIGPLTLNASGFVSPEFPAKSGAAEYAQTGVAYTITDWLSANANYGYQWIDKNANFGLPDYGNWNVGMTGTYKAYSLNLMYSQTSDLSKTLDKAKWVATLSASF